MVRYEKGILGNCSATAGTVAGGSWKGIDCMRSKSGKRKSTTFLKQRATRQYAFPWSAFF
jgi:hypothetical protein